MRRGASGGSVSVAVAVALLAQLCLAGDCVDGVTPDCSDRNVQCGPNVDGSAAASDSAANDAAPATDTGAADVATGGDASGDAADADASDQ